MEFARLLNVSVRTVQNWEQGRRRPTGPAVSLIRIVEREAPLVLRALRIPVPRRRRASEERWRPHGDSNPGRNRERVVS